jgi:hypothetical protein
LLAWHLRFSGSKEDSMASDLVSYAPLLIVFIVTALRLFVNKPTMGKQVSLRPWREILRGPRR